ncbi:anti-sigma factor family protein, partial [Actinoallomurus acaciae]
MTHLGERLTALVDGELGHDERDRALAHLAACDLCRAEADALRALKRRLRAMGDADPGERLLARLQAMGEPGDP